MKTKTQMIWKFDLKNTNESYVIIINEIPGDFTLLPMVIGNDGLINQKYIRVLFNLCFCETHLEFISFLHWLKMFHLELSPSYLKTREEVDDSKTVLWTFPIARTTFMPKFMRFDAAVRKLWAYSKIQI